MSCNPFNPNFGANSGGGGTGTDDHNALMNLTVGDVHTQYVFLNGRAGGQSVFGGVDPGENINLFSTQDATKGFINFGAQAINSGASYNEELDIFTIGSNDNTLSLNGNLISTKLTVKSQGSEINCFCGVASTPGQPVIFGGARSRGTLSSPTIVQNGDGLVSFTGVGYDGTTFRQSAAINFGVDGTAGLNDIPSSISFFTRQQGGSGLQLAMTIDSNQDSTYSGNIQFNSVDVAGINANQLTETQRDSLSSPDNGAYIYNSSTNKVNFRENGAWVELSSSSLPFITVGPSGADYTTVNQAINAGETNIVVIGNTTETVTGTITQNVAVTISAGVTVDTNDQIFNSTSASSVLYWNGPGALNINRTTTGATFIGTLAGVNSLLYFNEIQINNTSTTAGAILSEDLTLNMHRFIYTCPNVANCGIRSIQASTSDALSQGKVIGGGTNCTRAIYLQQAKLSNIEIAGSFTTASAGEVAFELINCAITSLDVDATNGPTLELLNSALSSCVVNNSSDFTINAASSSLSGLRSNSNGIILSPSGDDLLVSNSFFRTAGNFAGDRSSITNCRFIGGVIISGNDCSFIGNKFGTNISHTVTINAGTENTIFIGNTLSADLIDNSGNDTTQSFGNQVYA